MSTITSRRPRGRRFRALTTVGLACLLAGGTVSAAAANSPESEDLGAITFEEAPAEVQALVSQIDEGSLSADEVASLEAYGIDSVQIAAANGCSSWSGAVAVIGKQFEATKTNCSIIGTPTATKTYQWHIPDTSLGGRVCVTGNGYRLNQNKAGVSYWLGFGCGSASQGTVSWKNASGNPKIRHQAAVAPVAGVGFNWR